MSITVCKEMIGVQVDNWDHVSTICSREKYCQKVIAKQELGKQKHSKGTDKRELFSQRTYGAPNFRFFFFVFNFLFQTY